jgi:hypothetical protein
MSRDWVEKFETGEYIREWRGYSPHWIGGLYCDSLNINEDKYIHCMGSFSGIGDVDWWITSELEKLSNEEQDELEKICRYKKFIDNEAKPKELINKLSEFFDCEFYHIHRTGNEEILKFCRDAHNYRELILKNSKGSRDETTIKLTQTDSPFFIPTYDEYNDIMLKKEYVENKINYVIGFEQYRDGGTVEIQTIDGEYYIDFRLNTMTYGSFYDRYPKNGVQPITLSDEIIEKILEGLELFESEFYGEVIKNVIVKIKELSL